MEDTFVFILWRNIYNMLLDNYITYDQKVYIAIISASIWIYYRTLGCYLMLPRKSIFASILVSIWMYFNYYEPLSAPIGLIIMVLYSLMFSNNTFKL
jgi:hypothetical protein